VLGNSEGLTVYLKLSYLFYDVLKEVISRLFYVNKQKQEKEKAKSR